MPETDLLVVIRLYYLQFLSCLQLQIVMKLGKAILENFRSVLPEPVIWAHCEEIEGFL